MNEPEDHRPSVNQGIRHRSIAIDNCELFYREAGYRDTPTVLLLHGFPSSSIQFRFMMTELSGDWHFVAPDLPAFGFTRIIDDSKYLYSFANLASTLHQFIEKLNLNVAAVYLHDYGAQTGFRLLTQGAIKPKALIIQNAEAYRTIGWNDPMLDLEKRLIANPDEAREKLRGNLLNKEGIAKEFLEALPLELKELIDPSVIELGFAQVSRPDRIQPMLDLHMDYGSNIEQYSTVQQYFRSSNVPALILWGEQDQYLSTEAAKAYERDLRNMEFVQLSGGHWILETHSREVNHAVKRFLTNHRPELESSK